MVFVRGRDSEQTPPEYFGTILGATLTLLALIIGFSFSMATSRYDERKHLEEQEANAIGTEYVRAQVLPKPHAAVVQKRLRSYLHTRIAFYTSTDDQQLLSINHDTNRLQSELWNDVFRFSRQRNKRR